MILDEFEGSTVVVHWGEMSGDSLVFPLWAEVTTALGDLQDPMGGRIGEYWPSDSKVVVILRSLCEFVGDNLPVLQIAHEVMSDNVRIREAITYFMAYPHIRSLTLRMSVAGPGLLGWSVA